MSENPNKPGSPNRQKPQPGKFAAVLAIATPLLVLAVVAVGAVVALIEVGHLLWKALSGG